MKWSLTYMPFQATSNLCQVASDDPFIHIRYRAKDYQLSESEHLCFICWELHGALGYQWNPQNSNMLLNNTYSNTKMDEQGFSTTLANQWTVYLLWLREDNDWHCPSVNTLHSWWHARLRDSLHSVSPSFIFQMPVDILSWNMSSSMMQTSWRDKECVTNTAEKHCFQFHCLGISEELLYLSQPGYNSRCQRSNVCSRRSSGTCQTFL